MVRSISKFPTYRRRFRQIVKALLSHSVENDISLKSSRSRVSGASDEIV